MSDAPTRRKLPIRDQTSSGGVAFRRNGDVVEVALICAGRERRWQLPKGIVDPGETPEATALREVREEAGIHATLIAPLAPIAYWYVGTERGGARVRFRKRVHFFLLEYVAGDVADHDHEVHEARWWEIDAAIAALAFPSERKVAEEAKGVLRA